MVNIYLVRHEKVSGPPALYGHSDVDVATELQTKLADKINQSLRFQHVITSPLKRCNELCNVLTRQNANLTYEVSPDLQEMNFGDIDGVPFNQLAEFEDQLDEFSRNPATTSLPNAESLSEFHVRVAEKWWDLCKTVKQDTLIVTHGGVIRMILSEVLKLDWKQAELYNKLQIRNATVTHLELFSEHGYWVSVKSIGAPLTDSVS